MKYSASRQCRIRSDFARNAVAVQRLIAGTRNATLIGRWNSLASSCHAVSRFLCCGRDCARHGAKFIDDDSRSLTPKNRRTRGRPCLSFALSVLRVPYPWQTKPNVARQELQRRTRDAGDSSSRCRPHRDRGRDARHLSGVGLDVFGDPLGRGDFAAVFDGGVAVLAGRRNFLRLVAIARAPRPAAGEWRSACLIGAFVAGRQRPGHLVRAMAYVGRGGTDHHHHAAVDDALRLAVLRRVAAAVAGVAGDRCRVRGRDVPRSARARRRHRRTALGGAGDVPLRL